MCIGVPMKVLAVDGLIALCQNEEEMREDKADLSLMGNGVVQVGDWVQVFMGSVREIIDPKQLEITLQARKAMVAALKGENVDAYFADLVGREPQLPDFLQPKTNSKLNVIRD